MGGWCGCFISLAARLHVVSFVLHACLLGSVWGEKLLDRDENEGHGCTWQLLCHWHRRHRDVSEGSDAILLSLPLFLLQIFSCSDSFSFSHGRMGAGMGSRAPPLPPLPRPPALFCCSWGRGVSWCVGGEEREVTASGALGFEGSGAPGFVRCLQTSLLRPERVAQVCVCACCVCAVCSSNCLKLDVLEGLCLSWWLSWWLHPPRCIDDSITGRGRACTATLSI